MPPPTAWLSNPAAPWRHWYWCAWEPLAHATRQLGSVIMGAPWSLAAPVAVWTWASEPGGLLVLPELPVRCTTRDRPFFSGSASLFSVPADWGCCSKAGLALLLAAPPPVGAVRPADTQLCPSGRPPPPPPPLSPLPSPPWCPSWARHSSRI